MSADPRTPAMSIDQLLTRLGQHFGDDALPIRERWDEDVCAVGCVVAGEGERLVFVCPSAGTTDRYDATLEPEARRVSGLSLEALTELISTHLRLA